MKKLKDRVLNFEFLNKDNNFIDIEDLKQDLDNYKQVPFNNNQQDIDILALNSDNLDFSIMEFEDLNFYYKNNIVIAKDENEDVIVFTDTITKQKKEWLEKFCYEGYIINFTKVSHIRRFLKNYFIKDNIDYAINSVYKKYPALSAKNLKQKTLLFALGLICFASIILLSNNYVYALTFAIIYLIVVIFKFFLFFCSLNNKEDNDFCKKISQEELPIYSIIIPLYKEDKVIDHLIKSLNNIDYPKEKLDIKIVLEADDRKTIDKISAMNLPEYYDIVIVPDTLPKTKSKACNYVVNLLLGDYVTIYDAEDRPDILQLKKAVSKFRENEEIVCLQARLNYYNRKENLLSRFFAIEYSFWFDYMIQSLGKLQLPIPLGGTSNHIKVEILKKLRSWDAFNVTEDADLGLRIAKFYTLKTETLDSLTLEECPINIKAWINQRSRWIKGFIQTYLIYSDKENNFIRDAGFRSWLGLMLFIGMPTICFLLMPFIFCASYFQQEYNFLLKIIFYTNFFFSFFMYQVTSLIICKKNKWDKMFFAIILYPFYWFLHSIAAFKALWQLIFSPFYWEKTDHGISKFN